MAFSSILSGVYLFPNSPVLPSFPIPQLKPPLPHISYFQNSLWRWTFLHVKVCNSHSAGSSNSSCGPVLPTSVVLITSILGHMSDDGPAPTHHDDDSDVPSVIGEDVGWAPTVVSCFRLWFASNLVAVSLFPRLNIHSCVHFCLLKCHWTFSTSVQVYSFYDTYFSA